MVPTVPRDGSASAGSKTWSDELHLDAPSSSQAETQLATQRHNGKEKALIVGCLTVRPMFWSRSTTSTKRDDGRIHRMVAMESRTKADTRFDQLHHLIEQLRRHAPDWADRLSNAKTDREFLDVLCKLFDLSSTNIARQREPRSLDDLAGRIATFISSTLHQGPTLKTLAEWLGYSEKYCSELFRSVMGEPFSRYLARQRTEVAANLLITTDHSIGEIAAALGFSDQFSFSHFFKRATGLSPRAFRMAQTRRYAEAVTRPQEELSP